MAHEIRSLTRHRVPQAQATRRQFLKAVGLGGAIVGAGGLGVLSWRAADQGVFGAGMGPAYDAWGEWNHGSGPITVVRAAILSANPHNSQPWRFQVSSSAIEMYADLSRNIGAMDPFLRELHIGLGCSLENLVIAARAKGYQPLLTLMPNPNDPTLIAHVELSQGIKADEALYQSIPQRHTHRAPFDTSRALSSATLAGLDQQVAGIAGAEIIWITSDTLKSQIGQLIVEGAEAIAGDRQQSSDSFRWWRDSRSGIEQFKDGMTVDAAGLSPLVTALAKILPAQSRQQNDQAWIQQTRDNYVKTAAAFGVVVVRDPTDNLQRINGGRLYQRLHLAATMHGIAMQPLNTLTERIDRERLLGLAPRFTGAVPQLLGAPVMQALMSFRIGYPTMKTLPSPRRPAESVITQA